MQVSPNNFKEFYLSDAGRLAQKIICDNINSDMPNNEHKSILGFGFTTPILERLSSKPERHVNYFPLFGENETPDLSGLGQNAKPDIIGEAHYLPFTDSIFDKIICIHALEESDSPKQLLRELWRVLAPEGTLILIVPNRRGIWARGDNTPFGHGRPFTRTQLRHLLSDSLYQIDSARRILFNPPNFCNQLGALSNDFEKWGPRIAPTFGGLLYFKLSKRVFIEPPKQSKRLNKLEPALDASIFSNHSED